MSFPDMPNYYTDFGNERMKELLNFKLFNFKILKVWKLKV